MFNKEENKIVIMQADNVMFYPPTINLISCLLQNGYRVHLVSEGAASLPEWIRLCEKFTFTDAVFQAGTDVYSRIVRRFSKSAVYKKELIQQVEDGDLLWTMNPLIIRTLGKALIPYQNRHILHLFELMKSDTIPLYKGARFAKFNLKEYSQRAWKNVVSERNRAYIQKVQWNLREVPYVFPNKPYELDPGEPTEAMREAIQYLENEKRKIIVYLGVLDPDREFAPFAEAIEKVKEEYCFCLFGKIPSDRKAEFEQFCQKYSCVKYLGFYNPPHHLYFLRYAHIALLPYSPGGANNNTSSLNALYCAPNKIFEYAGNSVPMLGTDVLGLREPFERYNIGICVDSMKPDAIVQAIQHIDANRDLMADNCAAFYESVNLDKIVEEILREKNMAM